MPLLALAVAAVERVAGRRRHRRDGAVPVGHAAHVAHAAVRPAVLAVALCDGVGADGLAARRRRHAAHAARLLLLLRGEEVEDGLQRRLRQRVLGDAQALAVVLDDAKDGGQRLAAVAQAIPEQLAVPLHELAARERAHDKGVQDGGLRLGRPPLREHRVVHEALALEVVGQQPAAAVRVDHERAPRVAQLAAQRWHLVPRHAPVGAVRLDAVQNVLHHVLVGVLQPDLREVALAEALLEVLHGAEAAQAAADHDADARAQRLALLHRVRRQHDRHALALRRHRRNQVPHEAARDGVHARRRLVEEQQRRIADHRDRHAQLALVAAAQRPRALVRELAQLHVRDLVRHHVRHLVLRHALDVREQLQVLAHGQQVEQRVKLRAIAEQPPHLHLLRQDVQPRQRRRARRRQQLAAQDAERGRLARAVDAQEAEHLSRGDAKAEAAHGSLAPAVHLAKVLEDNEVVVGAAGRHALPLPRHVLVLHHRLLRHVLVGHDARAHRRVREADVDGDGEREIEHRLKRQVGDVGARHEHVERVVHLLRRHERAPLAAVGVQEGQRLHERQREQRVAEREAREQAVDVLEVAVDAARRRHGAHDHGQQQQDEAEQVHHQHHVLRRRVRLEQVGEAVGERGDGQAVQQHDGDGGGQRCAAHQLVGVVQVEQQDGDGRRHQVVERVPQEGGRPVGRDGHARDELLVLGRDLALLDQEHGERGGDEGEGDDHEEHGGRRPRRRQQRLLLRREGQRVRVRRDGVRRVARGRAVAVDPPVDGVVGKCLVDGRRVHRRRVLQQDVREGDARVLARQRRTGAHVLVERTLQQRRHLHAVPLADLARVVVKQACADDVGAVARMRRAVGRVEQVVGQPHDGGRQVVHAAVEGHVACQVPHGRHLRDGGRHGVEDVGGQRGGVVGHHVEVGRAHALGVDVEVGAVEAHGSGVVGRRELEHEEAEEEQDDGKQELAPERAAVAQRVPQPLRHERAEVPPEDGAPQVLLGVRVHQRPAPLARRRPALASPAAAHARVRVVAASVGRGGAAVATSVAVAVAATVRRRGRRLVRRAVRLAGDAKRRPAAHRRGGRRGRGRDAVDAAAAGVSRVVAERAARALAQQPRLGELLLHVARQLLLAQRALLGDLEEDLLKRGDADAVRLERELGHAHVEVREEAREHARRREGQLEGELGADVAQHLGLAHVRPHAVRDALAVAALLLDAREVVADAVERLEKVRGAEAADAAVRHDGDAVAQQVRLLHEVRRQDHDAALAVVLQDVPRAAARVRVHAAGRLVKEHDLGVADQRDGDAQLAALAAAQLAGLHKFLLHQAHLLDLGAHLLVHLVLRHALEPRKVHQVLAHRQVVPQHVVLRADAHRVPDLVHLGRDVTAVDRRRAAARLQQPRQHADGGRLAGTVVAQQREDLALVHGHGQVVDGLLGAVRGGEHLGQLAQADAAVVALQVPQRRRHGLDGRVRLL
mmetsp:Transcript_6528/g.23271  ORF Transcript_6528/g.23271 Transcript_6528/m.23271 type:complete len:1459 (-) Transcript_6528:109-4485(-)